MGQPGFDVTTDPIKKLVTWVCSRSILDLWDAKVGRNHFVAVGIISQGFLSLTLCLTKPAFKW